MFNSRYVSQTLPAFSSDQAISYELTNINQTEPFSLVDQSMSKDIPSTVRFDDASVTIFSKKLGEGSFGSVYLGEYKKDKDSFSSLVAVKFCHDDGGDDTEYRVMSALQAKQSPYLINLINYKCDDADSVMVIEYMEKGSLENAIETYSWFDWGTRLQMLIDSISGLSDMHEMGYLHRDIKVGNVLLDANFRAKLCDFGISCQEETKDAEEPAGTPLAIAPEVMRGSPSSRKSDIYSFGVVLLEVATWDQELTNEVLIPKGPLPGAYFTMNWPLRLKTLSQFADDHCPTDICHLVKDCLQMASDSRPTTENVKSRLTRMNKIHGEVRQVFFASKFDVSDKIAGLVREYAEEREPSSLGMKC